MRRHSITWTEQVRSNALTVENSFLIFNRECPNLSLCRNVPPLRVDDGLASCSSNNPLDLQSKEYRSKKPADYNMMPKDTTPRRRGGMDMPESGNSVHMRASSIVRRHNRADARNEHRHNKMEEPNKDASTKSRRRKAQKLFYREKGIVKRNTLTAEPQSRFLIRSPSPSPSVHSPANPNTLDILTRPASTKLADRERKMVQRVIATHGEYEFYSHNAIEHLAKVYWDEDLQEEAIEILQKGLELRQFSLGPEHPLNAYTMEQLAEFYLKKGEFHNAAVYLSCAAKILSKHFGEDDERTQSFRTVLADTMQKQTTNREF